MEIIIIIMKNNNNNNLNSETSIVKLGVTTTI